MRRPIVIVEDEGIETAIGGAQQVLTSRTYLAER